MSLVEFNEKYNIKYSDDEYEIYLVSYTHHTLNEVNLKDKVQGYRIVHNSFVTGYEIITPAFEHIYCDYIRLLFNLKNLDIPEQICTKFIELCNEVDKCQKRKKII